MKAQTGILIVCSLHQVRGEAMRTLPPDSPLCLPEAGAAFQSTQVPTLLATPFKAAERQRQSWEGRGVIK